ncbi:MAG: radical SAM protein [Pseudomonadota bacterium]
MSSMLQQLPVEPTSPAPDDVLARALRGTRVPFAGNFELTLRCNLNCSHCYLGQDRVRAELPTDEVLRILDELATAGTLVLALTGGEPLLRPDFEIIYLHAQRRGFLLSVFSNGIALTPRHVEMFCAAPPRAIEISLYGTSDEDYLHATGYRIAFGNLDRTLRSLRDARLPVRLKTMATRTLGPRLDDMRAYARELGIPLQFGTVLFSARDGSPGADGERLDAGAAVAFEAQPDVLCYLVERDRATMPTQDSRRVTCGAGRVAFSIDPAGVMRRCSALPVKATPAASLKHLSVQEAWRALGEQLECELPRDHPCRGCVLRHLCNRCEATFSPSVQVEMCAHAHARARQLGHCVPGDPPLRAYLSHEESADE